MARLILSPKPGALNGRTRDLRKTQVVADHSAHSAPFRVRGGNKVPAIEVLPLFFERMDLGSQLKAATVQAEAQVLAAGADGADEEAVVLFGHCPQRVKPGIGRQVLGRRLEGSLVAETSQEQLRKY